jgi:hypothetical protein
MTEKIAKLKMPFAQAKNSKTFTKKGKTRNVLGYSNEKNVLRQSYS